MNEFIQLREKDWQRLEKLVTRRTRQTPLTAREVHELGQLYRAVASDLALARRDYPNQPVVILLNQLLTRSHSFIYQQDVSDPRQFVRYFVQRVPQVFRQSALFVLCSFILFIIPAVISFRLLYVAPESAQVFGLEDQRQTLAEQETWTDIPVEERPYASAFIMSNNIRVALLAFAGGAAFGVFTIYILVTNGLMVGGVLGLAAHYGMGSSLITFIIGHGVIELSIIFIAGGAGLSLAWALLNPGLYTRRDALALEARRIVPLAVIAIPFLIVAGTIEGFISPVGSPFVLHALIGLGSGILMYAYLIFSGRGTPTA
ncbi:MAG: stage II sporulation protein M [Chloroflexota bacterium]